MKQINTVCLPCGRKHATKQKSVFGAWTDNCDMCGKRNVPCAAAGHDFGIYNNPEEKELEGLALIGKVVKTDTVKEMGRRRKLDKVK